MKNGHEGLPADFDPASRQKRALRGNIINVVDLFAPQERDEFLFHSHVRGQSLPRSMEASGSRNAIDKVRSVA
jgi:hypothetical protein